jgi:hypothetical protein
VQADEVSRIPLSLDVLTLQAAPPSGRPQSVAEGTKVRIRGFGVWSTADATLDFNDDTEFPGSISNIDLEDDLGMDLDQFTGGALVGFDFGNFHLDLSYNGYYDYDGDRVVGSIEFDDKVFTGRVISSVKLHEGMLNLRYDIWHADNVDLTLTPELGVHLFYIDADVKGQLTGQSGSVQFWAPVPTLGLGLRYGITDNLYVKGTAAGLYAGSYGNYYDLSAEVGYDFNRNFGIFAGYRFWSLDFQWDDNDVDVQMGGLFAGIEVRM